MDENTFHSASIIYGGIKVPKCFQQVLLDNYLPCCFVSRRIVMIMPCLRCKIAVTVKWSAYLQLLNAPNYSISISVNSNYISSISNNCLRTEKGLAEWPPESTCLPFRGTFALLQLASTDHV